MKLGELPIGSIVSARPRKGKELVVQLVSVNAATVAAVILMDFDVTPDPDYVIGRIQSFPTSSLYGLPVREWILERLDFVPADRKGWQLMFYYGDMKLLYRHDNRKCCGSFRFMSDYRKGYVSITCRFIHQLQNIMRFLTEDLEFEYQENYHGRKEVE